MDLGNSGQRTVDELFQAGLRRGGQRYSIAIAAQAGGDPENGKLVEVGNGLISVERQSRRNSWTYDNTPRELAAAALALTEVKSPAL